MFIADTYASSTMTFIPTIKYGIYTLQSLISTEIKHTAQIIN